MIRGYLKTKKDVFLLALFFAAVYGFLFYYTLRDMGLFLYALLVEAFIVFIFFVFDYPVYKRKIAVLKAIGEHPEYYSGESLTSDNDYERAYRDMADGLYEMNAETKKNALLARGEQIEYYSMWIHQIKTPICALRLALEKGNVQKSLLNEELFKIEQYVEMALNFVKLDSPDCDVVAQKCDIDKTVLIAVKKFAPLFIRKKLSVNFEKCSKEVISDEKWLAFIIEQFLSNAVKYTNSGGVDIKFEHDKLYISDSGIGIAPQDLPRVFEKGYTGLNGRLDKRASGLGLYMAKKAAQKLDVKLDMYSEIGKGSCAVIDFSDAMLLTKM